MLELWLRPLYEKWLLTPMLKLVLKEPNGWIVSPHTITIFGAMIGIISALLLSLGFAILAVIALLISGWLDSLDGAFARATDQSSPEGCVLDIFCDRLVECAIVLSLFSVAPMSRASLTLFMMCSILLCVTSFLLVGIFSQNESEKNFHYSRGLMERPEAFLLFTLMMLIPSWFSSLSLLFSILVFYTALKRLWEFFRQCNVQDKV